MSQQNFILISIFYFYFSNSGVHLRQSGSSFLEVHLQSQRQKRDLHAILRMDPGILPLC